MLKIYARRTVGFIGIWIAVTLALALLCFLLPVLVILVPAVAVEYAILRLVGGNEMISELRRSLRWLNHHVAIICAWLYKSLSYGRADTTVKNDKKG